MVQNGSNLLKRDNDLEAKLRNLIEAELQKIKEQQSQFSKNQTDKIKFGYSEKATKFEKIFYQKFDATE